MSTPFKNILIIGATGSIGSYVLAALLAEPSLTITVLKRASSTHTTPFPPHVRTITVPDTYPTETMTTAFRGQEAIICCLTTLNVADQFRLIDAAIAAGVRRYVPSEYGLNNMRPDAQALNGVFREKGAVQAYLRRKAEEGVLEWMSVSCGMWIKWSLQNEFLGLHVKGGERRVALWDGGKGRFSVNTEENTAKAVVQGLVAIPEETKNRNVLIEEFVVTQKELVEEIERQIGEKLVVEEEVDSVERIATLQAAVDAGDKMATIRLVEAGFITGRFGGDLSKEGEILTEKLGLERHSLQQVVAVALASLKE